MFAAFLSAGPSRTAVWSVWLSATGYFGISLFWIVEPFLVDIATHGWMAPFALLFMASGLALLWAIPAPFAIRISSVFLRSIGLITGLSLFEFLRSILFTGFPWSLPAYIWSDHPLMQLSAWIGPFGVTLFTLFISGLIGHTLFTRSGISGLCALAVLGIGWIAAEQRLTNATAETTDKTARLLQPNAAQHLKWKSDMIPVFFNTQLDMSRDAKAAGIDMIVWPETAVGYRLNQTPRALELITDAAGGVPTLFGGNSVVDDKFRNTLASMGSDGEVQDWYYKHHLVPFGEYIPLGEVLGAIGIRGLAARDGAGYDSGDGPKLLQVEGIGKVLPLICYELIFPRHLRTDIRPDLILQVTNDAWFGNISGPYQHLAQAKFRAVEQGIPLLRSANTGISAAIDPYGRVTAELALNTEGYLDVSIAKPIAPTLYSKTGDLPVLLLMLALMAGIVLRVGLGRRHV